MTPEERLDALTANTELMSHMLKDVIERIDKLAIVSERHERNWQRIARIVQAALQAGFDNGDEPEQEQE